MLKNRKVLIIIPVLVIVAGVGAAVGILTGCLGQSEPPYERITYTYQMHPHVFTYEEKEVGVLSFCTVQLDEDFKTKYPALNKKLEIYDGDRAFAVMQTFNDHGQIRGMKQNAENYEDPYWHPYYRVNELIPCRADSQVFSYMVYNQQGDDSVIYEIAGWEMHNIDPLSGEEILLSDVIGDREALYEAVASEITKHADEVNAITDGVISSEYGQYPLYRCITNETNDFIVSEGVTSIDPEQCIRYLQGRPEESSRNWALDYDGIWMSCMMGDCRHGCTVKIRYEDYPELFAKRYFGPEVTEESAAQTVEIPETEAEYSELP